MVSTYMSKPKNLIPNIRDPSGANEGFTKMYTAGILQQFFLELALHFLIFN